MLRLFLAIMLISPSLCFADPVIEAAKHLGLMHEIRGSPLAFPGVHRVYTDPRLERALLVLDQLSGKVTSKLEERNGYLLIEFPTSDSTYVSLAAVGISREEWVAYAATNHRMKSKKYGGLLATATRLLIPSASAETCSKGAFSFGSFSPIKSFFGSGYWSTVYSCASGILQGVWASTGGLVKSIGQGLWTLVTDPGKFWDDAVNQFRQMKDFIVNIDKRIGQIVGSIKSMPNDVRAELLCSFLGSIGTDIIIAALTAGAASGKVMISLAQYAKRLMKVEKLLSHLSKLKTIGKLPKSFFQKLAKGKIPDSDLNAIETLSKHGFHGKSMEVVQCVL
jgi:hypothetical protein